MIIEITDKNGFQADGTALPTDELVVTYGSELGTPKTIIWYCDQAAKGVYSGDTINGGFTNAALILLYNGMPEGEWYVTIENTDGITYVSESVIVDLEDVAIMSDVSIENDYETADAGGLDIDDETGKAILNVTFNKDYSGKLYVVNSKYEKGYDDTASDKGKNKIDFTAAGVDGLITESLTKVSTLANLTNKKATTEGAGKGIYYQAKDGTLYCKLVIDLTGGETVKRGDSYYLIWDQDDVDGDEIGQTGITRADLNCSEDVVVPYLEAPASIAVTKYSQGTAVPEITFYNEDGDVLDWWTDDTITVDAGIDSVKFFGVSSNTKSSSDTPTNATVTGVEKGVIKTTTAPTTMTAKYAYAKVVTDAGVFGEKAITLESELGESAIDALDKMSIAQSSSNPNDAEISFTGLSSKAPGKVYLFKEDKIGTVADHGAPTMTEFGTLELDDAIASAEVEGGATKVTLSGVFSYKDMADDFTDGTTGTKLAACTTDDFVALYVPDDTQLWKTYTNGAYDAAGNVGVFKLKPVITTVDKTNMTASLGSVTANGASAAGEFPITISGIQAMDQFGNKWLDVTAATAGAPNETNATSISKINNVVTNKEDFSVKSVTSNTTDAVDVSIAGVISFVVTLKTPTGATAVIDKGDGVTVKVPALKNLEVKITAKDALLGITNAVQVGATAGTANSVGGTLTDYTGATLVAPQAYTGTGTATYTGTLKLSDALSIS